MIHMPPPPTRRSNRTTPPSVAPPIDLHDIQQLTIAQAQKGGYRPLTSGFRPAQREMIEKLCGHLIYTGADIALVSVFPSRPWPYEVWRTHIAAPGSDSALAKAMHDASTGHCNNSTTRNSH